MERQFGRMGRPFKRLAIGALSLFLLGGFATTVQAQTPGAEGAAGQGGAAALPAPQRGAVFAMTNATDDNRIITYRRAADGALTRVGSISTRGKGIGTDLDSQGGLRLSDDHRFLYAVNAGSDDISVFSVAGANLRFLQKVAAGDLPISLTLHADLLYVLDGSVAGNGIRGFRVASDGTLSPLPDSFRALSSPIAVPGEIEFSPDGRVLLVTQKTTNVLLSPQNAIDAFRVGIDGMASASPRRNASAGLRPFSLAFRDDGKLVVAEAFNAAPGRSALSSYELAPSGRLTVESSSIRNFQTDTCWVIVSLDGKYAYTANFGSGTISSYRFTAGGRVHLLDGAAASLGDMSQPVDLALSADGHSLHLLLRGTGAVASFGIAEDGSLQPLGVVTGALPVADGASGLAAY